MRRFSASVRMVVAWCLATVVGPVGSDATTFVQMDDAELTRTSTAVVVATVTRIEAAELADGSIVTYIHVQPDDVLKGKDRVGTGTLVLRETGGAVGDRRDWIFGAPQFWVGEQDVLFLARNADGTLRTNAMALGKYAIGFDAAGRKVGIRDPGAGASMFVPETGEIVEAVPQTEPLDDILLRIRSAIAASAPVMVAETIQVVPPELDVTTTEVQEAYTFLGPARWIEPDYGQPVSYLIDQTGYAGLGFDASRAAVDSALAVWTGVPTASLVLVDGGTTTPTSYSGCGFNRIIFNDPYGEIPDPSGCSGVLAVGGFCSNGQQSVVNGVAFNRIVVGKITFNNGWEACRGWTPCTLAEVAAHELGHTIGLGHSQDSTATMRASAHFDGRCASLMADDVAGVTAIYPAAVVNPPVPAATATPTATPAGPTGGATATPTVAMPPPATTVPALPATPTRTPTRVPTRVPSPTATATALPTATPTPAPAHDSVVAVLRPKTLRIRSGRTTASSVVRVKVTNADPNSPAEGAGHQIRLLVDAGDCPAGTVVGAPDFENATAGDQDTVMLRGGRSKTARVRLEGDAAAFATQGGRCTLRFSASTVVPTGSTDPAPSNNTASLELNVVDANQPAVAPLLKSIAPVKLTIRRGAPAATYVLWPRLGSASRGVSNGEVSVAVAETDCPTAMLQDGGSSGAGRGSTAPVLVLAVDSRMFAAGNPQSPGRCRALLRASAPGSDPADPGTASTLVVDVLDKNDL